MRHGFARPRRAIGLFALVGIAFGAGGASAQDANAPLAVRITSSSGVAGGSSLEAVIGGVEGGFGHERWARLVPEKEEVLVTIYGVEKSQGSPTTDKKGHVTLQIDYSASARVAIGEWSETLFENKPDFVDAKTYYASVTDPTNFSDVGASLMPRVTALIFQRLDQLRPERPQPGFAFKPKFKFLFKGDG